MSERWRQEPHCCRACLGRIIGRDNGAMVQCADCGLSAAGNDPSAICACGVKLGAKVRLRCVENPNVSAEVPLLYVAVEAPPEPTRRATTAGTGAFADWETV
jgi:hypothetical protein